jgi:hypothetical protein
VKNERRRRGVAMSKYSSTSILAMDIPSFLSFFLPSLPSFSSFLQVWGGGKEGKERKEG